MTPTRSQAPPGIEMRIAVLNVENLVYLSALDPMPPDTARGAWAHSLGSPAVRLRSSDPLCGRRRTPVDDRECGRLATIVAPRGNRQLDARTRGLEQGVPNTLAIHWADGSPRSPGRALPVR
jgi:hypothetical protein